jgi:dihydroflavonol-4-reductase
VSAPVLVTGGTGFLGAEVVRRLAARGRAVHVLARPSADRDVLADVDVRWHPGDLVDEASVERAVGAAAREGPLDVVHSGAVISYRSRDSELQRMVNVEGTWNVVAACRLHGVRRLVHVSSIVAVGHAPGDELLDEDWPFNGLELHVDYVTTKRAAEEVALGAAAEVDVVAVNPGAIWGPSPRGSNSMRSLRLLAQGALRFAPPGRFGVVGLGDTADGVLRALDRGQRGRRYVLVESNWRGAELFRLATDLLGARPVRRTVPAWVCPLAAAGATWLDRVRPLEVVTPQLLRLMPRSFAARSDRAREELGWAPRPFPDVLAEAVAALRAEAP